MDCPNCGRRGLVQKSDDIYQCLCCRFRANLSEPTWAKGLVWTVITLILATLLLGGLGTEEHPKDSHNPLQSLKSMPELLVIWLIRST